MSSELLKYSIDILMVEDNAADVRLTEEALNDSKMLNSLTVVEDGEAALDFLYQRGRYASAERPDLVLLDLNVPKVDGREVLRIMKSDASLKSIPVVIVTSSISDQHLVSEYGLRPDCYVTKPVDFRCLLQIVRTIDYLWLEVLTVPPMSASA